MASIVDPPPDGKSPLILPGCMAGRDGECDWRFCPQLRDGEPAATGRHCPIDVQYDDWGDPEPADVARCVAYLNAHPLGDAR